MRKQADPLPVGVQKEGPAPLGYLRDLPKLIHLQTLTLSDNEIAAFPFSICNIPTLKCLDLSRNLLVFETPNYFQFFFIRNLTPFYSLGCQTSLRKSVD